MKDITLVILAAGMGSRFGGLKQIEPMGPNGEFIIDYSIYDAIRSGFTKVVFIIKKENYEIFKETIGSRVERHINVEYVFQEIDDIPEGYIGCIERVKPWGTAHAIYTVRNKVNENFVIINADDFYGRDAFNKAASFLKEDHDDNNKMHFALVGYLAKNTLAESGSVKRGVCEIENNYLKSIIECSLEKIDNKIIAKPLDCDTSFEIKDNGIVSMNMMCFTKDLFRYLEEGLKDFLEENKDNLEKCEYLIPTVLKSLIQRQLADVRVIDTTAEWYGVTYKEDKDMVINSIQKLIDQKEYPQELWKK